MQTLNIPISIEQHVQWMAIVVRFLENLCFHEAFQQEASRWKGKASFPPFLPKPMKPLFKHIMMTVLYLYVF